tara:strand:+ start:1959 stop:2108 length:150 start_codon:yes stop_codon:yes gene_type:complete
MDFITEKQREAIKSGLIKIEYRITNTKNATRRIDYVEDICFLSDEEKTV